METCSAKWGLQNQDNYGSLLGSSYNRTFVSGSIYGSPLFMESCIRGLSLVDKAARNHDQPWQPEDCLKAFPQARSSKDTVG